MSKWHPIAALAALLLCAGTALAQNYPVKVVRIVIPYGTGGLSDTLTRAIAQKLTEKWGQPVLIENRPGANGIIGTEHVAKSAGDGYTLLVAESSIYVVNQTLYDKLPYDPVKDFAPITMIVFYGTLLAVHPSVPANSLREFIALAKAKPGALTYGSFGSGSGAHLNTESFKLLAGLDIVHVPYKGASPAVVDLLAGRISMLFITTALSAEHIRAGRMRGLAYAAPKRSPVMPDLPTFAEAGGPAFEATSWFGMVAPAATPRPLVARINKDVVSVMMEPTFRSERYTKLGTEPVGNSPEEFAAVIRKEAAHFARIIKQTGAKPD
jgi:tripartite-type tricarboxylate transporter receptor subunit TctC